MSEFEKRSRAAYGDGGEQDPPAWQKELITLLENDSERAQGVRDRMDRDPGGLVDEMAEDPVLLEAVARADVVSSMRVWFSDRDDGWRASPGRSGRLGQAAAIEWSFLGTHDVAGTLNHLPATNRPVAVHGVSIFGVEVEADEQGHERDRFKVRRHIDWAGVYAQLGLSLNWRVPLDPPPNDPSASAPDSTD
jgi:hypothetical protein